MYDNKHILTIEFYLTYTSLHDTFVSLKLHFDDLSLMWSQILGVTF